MGVAAGVMWGGAPSTKRAHSSCTQLASSSWATASPAGTAAGGPDGDLGRGSYVRTGWTRKLALRSLADRQATSARSLPITHLQPFGPASADQCASSGAGGNPPASSAAT